MPSLMVPDHVARVRKAQIVAEQTEQRNKTLRGEFIRSAWNGTNESGREPIGDRVLVLPDQAARKSEGGILTPDEYNERTDLAAESGVLVAIGQDAWIWNSDRTRRLEGEKPQVGDRVYFARYQYVAITGQDGRTYWLMEDKSIAGRDAKD